MHQLRGKPKGNTFALNNLQDNLRVFKEHISWGFNKFYRLKPSFARGNKFLMKMFDRCRSRNDNDDYEFHKKFNYDYC